MVDSLIPASSTQALVLADAREQTLATLDDASKRKAKWAGQSVPKKGKRWGLADDKPFKPLPYVDLPVGLSEQEVDQFLREQRLENLHHKIQLHQLEDVEPDIRPPSPPPVYDRSGNRLNTREIRIRKAMLAEYNRLVRYMIKAIDGYHPPADWKPQKLIKKIIIPYERFPQAPFMGVIIGARGVNHKRLQESSGCKIFIRGRDIGDKFQSDEEQMMPQHIHMEADQEEQIEAAEKLIMPLLNPESPEFEYARTHGMQQVALVNGVTLKKIENRCGICGAVGHLGFDCPEVGGLNYKMANVVCSICGDKGHVASDCKVAAEKHQRENVDWKADAEKKQQMDEEYANMMSELGIPVQPAADTAPSAPPTSKAAMAGAEAARALADRVRTPVPVRPLVVTTGRPPTAPPRAALPIIEATTRPLGPPSLSARGPARPGLGYAPPTAKAPTPQTSAAILGARPLQLRPSATLAPVVALAALASPRPLLNGGSRPLLANLRPVAPVALVPRRPSLNPAAPRGSVAPFMTPAYTAATASTASLPAINHTSSMANLASKALDSGLTCPAELVGRLLGGEIHEISQDCGAQVQLTNVEPRRFLVVGPPEVLDTAKLHIRAWLDVNTSRGMVPPAFADTAGMPTPSSSSSMPPIGFPPGMDLGGDAASCQVAPMGFPPAGFPPAIGTNFSVDIGGCGCGVGHPGGLGDLGEPPPGFPPGFSFPPGCGGCGCGAAGAFAPTAGFPPGMGGMSDGLGYGDPVLNDDPEI